MLDAFSDVLRVIRLSGGVFLEAEFTAPWCINGKISAEDCKPFLAAPRHVIASHFVAAGHMQLRIDGGAPSTCAPANSSCCRTTTLMSSAATWASRPCPARDVIQPPRRGGIARIEYGGGGEATQLLCGFLGSETPFSPLLSSLPPRVETGRARNGVGRVDRELVSFRGERDRGGPRRLDHGHRQAVRIAVRRGREPVRRQPAG